MTVPLHDTDDASPIPGGRRNQVSPLGGGESRRPAASSARPAPWPPAISLQLTIMRIADFTRRVAVAASARCTAPRRRWDRRGARSDQRRAASRSRLLHRALSL